MRERAEEGAGALAACLLLSGAAALVYEVVWARLLSLVMGHTAYALSAILSGFLGGLALGAWLMGRWTRRGLGSLKLYAGIEVCIAIFAVAMPWLIEACSPLFTAVYRNLGHSFVQYNLVQFGICGALILIPSALMGTTLPLVISVLLRNPEEIGRETGWLYGANTLGGAIGAGAAGFALLPSLGIQLTGAVAGGLNLLVAGIALGLSRRLEGRTAAPSAPPAAAAAPRAPGGEASLASGAPDWPAPRPALLIPAYLLAGIASLALQVGWVRVVSLSIGSTTYGFSVTLVTFITGLGFGSYLGGHVGPLARRPVRALFWLNVTIAFWALFSLPYLGSLPIRVVQLIGGLGVESFGRLLLGESMLVWSTILIPTLAMGAMFPLIAQLLFRSRGVAGEAVGQVYAANTLGNIIGAFIAGFVLVPAFGMRGTIVASAILSALVAASFIAPMVRSRPAPAAGRLAALGAAVAAGVIWMPGWDRSVITSGPFMFASEFLLLTGESTKPDDIRRALEIRMGEMLDYAEGPSAVVSVRRMGQHYFLDVGGYTEGLRFGSTQQLISHAPLLLHPDPEDVLVVGLGGGTTVASALMHPIKRVDAVEISEAVRRMAVKHFSAFNHHALDDPRTHLIIGDGRNHLRHTERKYDVIISQPSMPWVSGAAGLFTRGAFQDMHDRLKPGGIACVWYQSWAIGLQDVRSLLKTWADVFPGAYLFQSRLPGEIMMIGLRDGGKLPVANVISGLRSRPAARRDLEMLRISTAGDIFSNLLVGPEAMKKFGADAPINSDDNAFVEFTSPTGLLRRDELGTAAALLPYGTPPVDFMDMTDVAPGERAALQAQLEGAFRSRPLILDARRLARDGIQNDEFKAIMTRAAELNPRDPFVMQWSMTQRQLGAR